jgi:hypothetical protein
VPGQPERASSAPAPALPASFPAPASNTNGNGSASTGHPWEQTLLAQTSALIDVYAAALAYSSGKYGNTVKPDDVRNLLTTCWVSQTRNGGPHVA